MRLVHKATIYHPDVWQARVHFAISQDGQLIVVRSDKNIMSTPDNIYIYDTKGNMIDAFGIVTGGETGVAFWPDKHHILTPGCSPDNNINYEVGLICKRWGSDDYTVPHSYAVSGMDVQLYGVSDSGRYVMTGRSALCIDTQKRNAIRINIKVSPQLWVFSSNDKFMGGATAHFGSVVVALPSGEVVWGDGRFLCFLPDGRHVISRDGSYSNSEIVVWELPTCTVVSRYPVNEHITIAAYSSDGQWLVTGDEDGNVCLRNTLNYTVETKLNTAHTTPIQQIKFSIDNTEVITISKEDIIIWRLEAGYSNRF